MSGEGSRSQGCGCCIRGDLSCVNNLLQASGEAGLCFIDVKGVDRSAIDARLYNVSLHCWRE